MKNIKNITYEDHGLPCYILLISFRLIFSKTKIIKHHAHADYKT